LPGIPVIMQVFCQLVPLALSETTFLIFIFWDTISPLYPRLACSPGWSWTQDPPFSVFWVLELIMHDHAW
jgi:hypothetical protein